MRKLALALVLFSFSAFADARLEKALDLLDPDQRPEQPDDAALGHWQKDLWVVAAVYDQSVQSAVLRETNGRFTLVARSDGRLHGGTLRQVFVTLTQESNWDKSDRDGVESEWVVILSKKARKGFYDLLVRNKETKETTTYRWNGSEYVQ